MVVYIRLSLEVNMVSSKCCWKVGVARKIDFLWHSWAVSHFFCWYRWIYYNRTDKIECCVPFVHMRACGGRGDNNWFCNGRNSALIMHEELTHVSHCVSNSPKNKKKSCHTFFFSKCAATWQNCWGCCMCYSPDLELMVMHSLLAHKFYVT